MQGALASLHLLGPSLAAQQLLTPLQLRLQGLNSFRQQVCVAKGVCIPGCTAVSLGGGCCIMPVLLNMGEVLGWGWHSSAFRAQISGHEAACTQRQPGAVSAMGPGVCRCCSWMWPTAITARHSCALSRW